MKFQVSLTRLDYENTRGSDRHSPVASLPGGMTAMIDRETEHDFLGFRLVQENTGGDNEGLDNRPQDETGDLVEGHRGVGSSSGGKG